MEAEILSNLDRQAPVIRARLYPGTDEAWLVESTDTAPFNWVQFVAANDVEPTHVWDGRQVFRRA
jgi:hypothetical protein